MQSNQRGLHGTIATTGAHRPAARQADGVLAARTLRQQDQETGKVRSSDVAGGDDGVAAHRLLGKMTGLAPEGLTQMPAGQPTGDPKRNALVRFGRTLAETSSTIRARVGAGWSPI